MSFDRTHVSSSLTIPILDSILDGLLDGLAEHFGYGSLLLTAASATALLDHCFDDQPIRMRDFDLVLLAGRRVDRPWANEIGQTLSSPGLRFLPRHLWPRQRCHPDRPSEPWLAGWGFLLDADGFEVDLSIYHDAQAHDTNGLLDIHRVRIPIGRSPESTARAGSTDPRGPIARIVEELRGMSVEEALASDRIEDPWNGYPAWRRRTARVVNWPAIRLEPIQCAIRIVRDYVQKLERKELDAELAAGLRRAIDEGSALDTAHLDTRNLLKVLTDRTAAQELRLLEGLGVFRRWLPGLDRCLGGTDPGLLERWLDVQDPATPWVEARLHTLLTRMSPGEQSEVLAAVALPEQELAESLGQRLGTGRGRPGA